jgi:hypothetical protein
LPENTCVGHHERVPVTSQRYEPDVDLTQLVDHPRNPRRGDDAAVSGSVNANGFYGAIVAQVGTGYILAGHTRRRVLAASGSSTAPVLWVDCDDDTAVRILLADNRTAELAHWDEADLVGLLRDLTPDDLIATSFTEFDLGALVRSVEGEALEDFPEFTEDIATEHQCPSCGYAWSGGGKPKAKSA